MKTTALKTTAAGLALAAATLGLANAAHLSNPN